MFRQYSFIWVLFGLIAGLRFLSGGSDVTFSSPRSEERPLAFAPVSFSTVESSVRRELLETMDRIVHQQKYYHSIHGQFIEELGRLGVTIPQSISRKYEIRVAAAGPNRLLMTATSIESGEQSQIRDFVSMDQNFHVEANFLIPPPRPDYLSMRALQHLHLLQGMPEGYRVEEDGAFRGYFRYEVRRDPQNRQIAFAIGVRPPVTGVQLDSMATSVAGLIGEEGESLFDLGEKIESHRTGQRPDGLLMNDVAADLREKASFKNGSDQVLKGWDELSRVARLHFHSTAEAGEASVSDSKPQRDVASEPKIVESHPVDGLVIEKIQ